MPESIWNQFPSDTWEVYPILASTEYIKHYDEVAKLILHWNTCKRYNTEVENNCYNHKPKTLKKKDQLWELHYKKIFAQMTFVNKSYKIQRNVFIMYASNWIININKL